MRTLKPSFRAKSGFLLLETILAVAIFAGGALAIGWCVRNCLRAERFRREEALAQRALANYLVQIETESLPLTDKMNEKLKGAWTGMTMNITRQPLALRNEKDQQLFGLYKVIMELSWKSGEETVSRSVSFYTYPSQQ